MDATAAVVTKEAFETKVVNTLKEFLPETKMEIRQITKQNDRVLDELIISSENTDIAPAIYLDSYYDAFMTGDTSFEEVVEHICRLYEDNKTAVTFNQDAFLDWNRAKERIVCRIVNKKANENFLQDVPHVDFLDLSIVFSYLITIEDAGQGNIVIHQCHADEWGVTADDLYEAAKKSAPALLPATIKGMFDTLGELLGGSSDVAEMQADGVPDMTVLSNATKTFGAAAIIYDGVQEALAKRVGGSYYVLPSSVHELLILPATDERIDKNLDVMVKEVNANEVPDGEVLSDHCYFYDAEAGELTMGIR